MYSENEEDERTNIIILLFSYRVIEKTIITNSKMKLEKRKKRVTNETNRKKTIDIEISG